MGLKPPGGSWSRCIRLFQTNPRGVEAANREPLDETVNGFRRTLVGLKHLCRSDSRNCRTRFRRTLVGLKQPGINTIRFTVTGFRRTLVGLKPETPNHLPKMIAGFQTNPRGVEASSQTDSTHHRTCFRRTLVGLKRARRRALPHVRSGFRRALHVEIGAASPKYGTVADYHERQISVPDLNA